MAGGVEWLYYTRYSLAERLKEEVEGKGLIPPNQSSERGWIIYIR